MNKLLIDGVIVVEGKNDVSFLSSFIDAYFVITNGCDLNEELISFLKLVEQKRQIFLLLDPDEAGLKIRNKLMASLSCYKNINVDINKCNKHNKHGIAECKKEEIIKVLEPFCKKNIEFSQKLTTCDLLYLNALEGCVKTTIVNKFHLGNCNNKTMLNKLNMLKVTKEELREIIAHGN